MTAGTPFLGSDLAKSVVRSTYLTLVAVITGSGQKHGLAPSPNNSLKPSPLRGLGKLAGYDFTIANAAQRPGLAQALGRIRKIASSGARQLPRSWLLWPGGVIAGRLARTAKPEAAASAGCCPAAGQR